MRKKITKCFCFLILLVGVISAEEGVAVREILDITQHWCASISRPQENSQDVFAWFNPIPHPRVNCIFDFSHEDDVGAKLDSLLDKAPSGVPVAFWIHPKNRSEVLIKTLRHRQFGFVGTFPAMIWEVQPVEDPSLEVQPADMSVFHQILAEALRFNPDVQKGYATLLEEKGGEHYLVYLDGKPIGTGTLFIKEDMGAVFHIATLPEYQRRGAGRAMMQFLMNKAYTMGLKRLVLHSSHVGEKLYASLGFQKDHDIEVYMREPQRNWK